MELQQFLDSSRSFLGWMVDWYNTRPRLELAQVLEEAGGPDRVVVFAVDVTTGFCSKGSLASVRVGRIVRPIARLFARAHDLGAKHYILPQDTHSPDAVEFASFPAHCVRGTDEPVTVPELSSLPFSGQFWIIEKDSISSDIDTGLQDWLASHSEVVTAVVTGDCTDFCVYQLAMYLRLRANALKLRGFRVIVPMNAVDTFHFPVETAQAIGAMPHDGDLMHLIFLFGMGQNGIEIVAEVV